VLEIIIEKAFKKDIARAKKSGLYSEEDFELGYVRETYAGL